MSSNILVIPDTQCKEGQEWPHLAALGSWIATHQPDVIVHLGDHFDMESLSSYDRGTKKAEGKRVYQDIAAGKAAMDVLLHDLRKLQAKQRYQRKRIYTPRLIFLIGNHEERIMRHVNANPELEGFLDYSHLGLEEWEVYDFLEPVNVENILFAHYFYNPNSGRPFGGSIVNRLNKVKESFVQGHEQTFIFDRQYTAQRTLTGLVAGAFYMHDEDYKGPQGNTHWRGVIMLHDAEDGDYRKEEIPLSHLLERYSNATN